MSEVKVPKSMPAEDVIWAFRYGIATALMHQRVYGPIRRLGGAYQVAPRAVFLLADRVRREYVRRHPNPGGSR